MSTTANVPGKPVNIMADGIQFRALHLQVREHVRKLIMEDFKHGDKFFSEPVLIQRLGVSQGTVRRAMTDLAREGLLVRRVAMGTFVCKNNCERFSVAVFISDYNSPFEMALLEKLAVECRESRHRLKVVQTHLGKTADEALCGMEGSPQDTRVVLKGGNQKLTDQLSRTLTSRGFRSVNVDAFIPGYAGSYVGVDNEAGIRLGFDHLFELGHRQIALLVDEPMELGSVIARRRAFERMVKERGLSQCPVWDCETKIGEDPFETASQKMGELWSEGTPVTAVFAVSDSGAWAALKWFSQRGIEVPKQVSVLGFDDDSPSRFVQPSLSTVAQPLARIAHEAMELLSDDSTSPRVKYLPPHLVIRESTGVAGAFPVGNKRVSKPATARRDMALDNNDHINAEANRIVVAGVANGSQAVEQWQRHKPDLTRMDLRLAGLDGVPATAHVCEAFPEAVSLVRTAERPALTEREDEILRLLVKGLSNKEIGAAVSLSELTVKRHVGHLLYKLHVRSRTQAAVEAIRRGLVQLP
ncbi:MAG: substrate-binding domain-containing protein [Verrucomicrobiales bacterium]|nr:substrate-binding domain-containing protein [Verrucomicrobiales bacterium]